MTDRSLSPSPFATLAAVLLALALTISMTPAGLGQAASTAAAEVGWQPAPSPAGAPAQDVGGNDQVLVVNTWDEGTFRSTDDGRTWTPVDAHGVHTGEVVFDPSDPEVGYIAGFEGIARTTDAGQSWELVQETDRSRAIDVHPDGTVAASVRTGSTHASQTFVLSDDGGDTWTELTKPYEDGTSLAALAFGPTPEDILVASLTNTWVTHDGGETWTTQDQGARWLVSDDDGTLWRAGMGETHRSEDGSFEEHPERSTDAGETWEPIDFDHLPRELAPHPEDGLYVAAREGVHLTTDGGDTWTDMGAGEVARAATGMVADPADPDAVFFSDEEIGVNWVGPAADGDAFVYEGRTQGFPPAEVWTMATSPSGDVVLAGGPQGLYATGPDQPWVHAGAGLGVPSMEAVAAGPGGEHLYAGGQTWIRQPYVQAGSLSGTGWQGHLFGQDDGRVIDLEVDPDDGERAWAAVKIEVGPDEVHRTTDGGDTWTQVLASGYDAPAPVPDVTLAVRDLAYDAGNDTLLVGTEAGVLAHDGTGPGTLHPTGATGAHAVATDDGRALAASQTSLWQARTPADLWTPWATTGEATDELALGPGSAAWALRETGTVEACTPGQAPLTGTCEDASPPRDAVSIAQAEGTLWAASLEDGLYTAEVSR